MKKNIGSLLAMALMAEGIGMGMEGGIPNTSSKRVRDHNRVRVPAKKVIPKGCKQYFFNQNGYWDNTSGEKNSYFTCIASSDKVAHKKFNKYQLILIKQSFDNLIHIECLRTGKCQETEGLVGTEYEGISVCDDGCVQFNPRTKGAIYMQALGDRVYYCNNVKD